MPPPGKTARGFQLPREAPDGRIYVTTTQAAELAQVAVCTISKWKKSGLLTPHPDSPPRQPVYDLEDVRTAEQAARRKAIEDGHGYWAQRRPGLRRRKEDTQ
jgi:hypothetical protein